MRQKILHEMERQGYWVDYRDDNGSRVVWRNIDGDKRASPTAQRTHVDSDGGGRIVMQVLAKERPSVGMFVVSGYTSITKSVQDENSEHLIVQEVLECQDEPNQGWYWARVVTNEPREYKRDNAVRCFGTYSAQPDGE